MLFDFDGTLTRPGALDFPAVKREIGCPADSLVLEWIEALPAGAADSGPLAALERFELDAAAESVPNAGAERVIRSLRAQGLKVGVLTRNGLSAVRRALSCVFATSTPATSTSSSRATTRIAPKPAPDGVLHAAAAMGVPPEETLVVGDFVLDVQAGRAAGALTAYLTNGNAGAPSGNDTHELGRPEDADCDFVVHGLAELDDVVRLGLPLPNGKLPNELLARYLRGLATADPSVLVPPASART